MVTGKDIRCDTIEEAVIMNEKHVLFNYMELVWNVFNIIKRMDLPCLRQKLSIVIKTAYHKAIYSLRNLNRLTALNQTNKQTRLYHLEIDTMAASFFLDRKIKMKIKRTTGQLTGFKAKKNNNTFFFCYGCDLCEKS